MLTPLVTFYHAPSRGSVGALITRKLFLSSMGVHVTLEVVVRGGAVRTVGAGEWFLTSVSIHMSLKVSDKMAGVGAVRALMHLPVALILG